MQGYGLAARWLKRAGGLSASRRLRHPIDLLRELIARDLKVRYQDSALGFAWALVNPLLYVFVFVFIFQHVLALSIPRYTSFALIGILAYTWFQNSISQAASAIQGHRELVKRPGFPVAVLPVVTVSTNLIHFLLAFPILALFLLVGGSELSADMLLLPAAVAVQFLLTLGLAYLVAALNVIFRDTRHILDVLLRLLFFLTPIFYDATHVPTEYRPLYDLNPLVHLLTAYRGVLLDSTRPDWHALLVVGLAAVALLYVGYQTFVRTSYRFAEEL